MTTSSDEQTPRYAKYLRRQAGLLAVAFALVATANVVVDPNGYLPVPAIPGFNATKYFADATRTQKSIRLTQGEFDTIVAGTSRALVGIDPTHPSFAGRRVFNSALRGTNLYEMERVLEFARREQHVELLVWGLDLLAFSGQRTTARDFESSLFDGRFHPTWLASYLLSSDTARKSWATVRRNRKASRLHYHPDSGFFDLTGSKIDHRTAFTRVLVENFLVSRETYGGFEYSQDRLERFRKILDDFSRDGTRIVLFVSPVHARQLEAMDALGLFESFEGWKRDLVRVVDEVERERGVEIALWDFSGYTTITSEDVPPAAGDAPASPMRWYWDSSHYKKETGGLLLDRILGGDASAAPADFGVRLTPETLEPALARIRRDRERYRAAHPDEVADVIRLAEATRDTREANRRQ